MFEPLKDIRARVVCEDGKEKIKRFTPLDELPPVGMKIIATKYYYGDAKKYELSKFQRTRDDEKHGLFDFYAVNAVDEKGNVVGELYYCIPHERVGKRNYKMYHQFLADAREYKNVDEFVEACLTSDVWNKYDIPIDGQEEWLRKLYAASNMTVEELIKSNGMNYSDFCVRFGIPRRTVDNWIYVHQPPLYLLAMFEELLGVISLE